MLKSGAPPWPGRLATSVCMCPSVDRPWMRCPAWTTASAGFTPSGPCSSTSGSAGGANT